MSDPRQLMTVVAQVGGQPIREDLAALAKIGGNRDGVVKALTDQVDSFAWWSTLETLAAGQEQDAKDALDALEADLMEGADPKATVTAQKAAARRDPRYQQLHAAWRSAQAQTGMIKVGRRTCEERRACLSELNKLLCAEMATGLQPRARSGESAAGDAEAAHRDMLSRVQRIRK